MENQVLHTVWCYIPGEAAGEIWNWSLLGVKGLSQTSLRLLKLQVCCALVSCSLPLSLLGLINLKFPLHHNHKYLPHSMKNWEFHGLLRWKMITQPILTTSLTHFLFEWIGECSFWVKGRVLTRLYLVFSCLRSSHTTTAAPNNARSVFWLKPLLRLSSISRWRLNNCATLLTCQHAINKERQ